MGVSDFNYVYESLKSRGVTRLCHFTKIDSLVNIITSPSGILATRFIQNDIKKQNDTVRADGLTDYVCCSIEYPNSWYWNILKKRDEDIIFREWVILCIDTEIVKYRNIKFCPCNAAYGGGQFISEDLSEFDKLFAECTHVGTKTYSRPSSMLTCCPTDGQSEILIEHDIPPRYIKSIIVGNEHVADHINAILTTCKFKADIYIAPDVCNTNWSSLVRMGNRPTENKYNAD